MVYWCPGVRQININLILVYLYLMHTTGSGYNIECNQQFSILFYLWCRASDTPSFTMPAFNGRYGTHCLKKKKSGGLVIVVIPWDRKNATAEIQIQVFLSPRKCSPWKCIQKPLILSNWNNTAQSYEMQSTACSKHTEYIKSLFHFIVFYLGICSCKCMHAHDLQF